jgi:hypothetical protein
MDHLGSVGRLCRAEAPNKQPRPLTLGDGRRWDIVAVLQLL